ncbi:MAG: type II toxin-antitoxin system VapB family antitoxin [Methylococcus sp.]
MDRIKKTKTQQIILINEELLGQDQGLSGLQEKTALIERESAIRLAKLGGSEPQSESIPRRRSET